MKMQELKEQVRQYWELSCEVTEVFPQWENFPTDIKRFGDRRFKRTWEKAYAHYKAFSALRTYTALAPGIILKQLFLEDTPQKTPYRELFMEALVELPQGVWALGKGLKELMGMGEDCSVISQLVKDQRSQGRLRDTAVYPALGTAGIAV